MYRKICVLFLIAILSTCGQSTITADNFAYITHHKIVVTINPDDHSIKGTDEITVNLPQNQNEIEFCLNRTIGKVELIDSPGFTLVEKDIAKYKTNKIDNELKAKLRYYAVTAERPDSMVAFKLNYEGIIFDTLKASEQEYSRGFATTSGLIEPRGVYLTGSSGWIPTQDHGMFTFNLKTLLPVGWQSISQGEETIRRIDGDYQINEWTCNEPMEEIYLIVGKYIITEEDHHGIKVMTYTYQEDPNLTKNYRDATKRYLDMYEKQIGPYPYKKFALVENFWQTGYGMPSFTLLGSQIIRLPFIIHTSYGHEILHNWWGNGVYVDWDSGNWCEGLTNYMADHYYKKLAGEGVSYRRTMLQSYLNYVQTERDFPLTDFRERHNPATQAIGYNKSAMVYHTLYQLLGEEKFYAAIRSFYKNNLFKKASWADLEKEFNAQYDKGDLHWFFDQWINRQGAPRIKIEDLTFDAQTRVEIKLSQETPIYRLLVPIRFAGTKDTTIHIWLESEQQSYSFEFKDKPNRVEVDPNFDLFRKLDRSEIPPALSQTFGALQSLVLLPGSADRSIYQAYQKMAESWGTSNTMTIKSDAEVTDQDLKGKAVWVLGTMNSWFSKFIETLPDEAEISAEQWRLENQQFSAAGHSLVLTARHPDEPELSWTLVHVADPADFSAIGRKLPHYGKYGYLIFEGGQNVLKGEWRVRESPLIRNIVY